MRQLKQTGLCLPPKRQQRRGGPDLCWQTVPRLAAATGKARSPRVTRRVGGTSSVVVSAERRCWRATNSDVGRRLSARYAGAVPCTQWYARTHNQNWICSGTRNQWRSRSSGVVWYQVCLTYCLLLTGRVCLCGAVYSQCFSFSGTNTVDQTDTNSNHLHLQRERSFKDSEPEQLLFWLAIAATKSWAD